MGKQVSNKKLECSITLPERLTGEHWEAYNAEISSHSDKTNINASYLGALKVVEAAECAGLPDLKGAGLTAPFGVIAWIASEVDRAFAACLDISKN